MLIGVPKETKNHEHRVGLTSEGGSEAAAYGCRLLGGIAHESRPSAEAGPAVYADRATGTLLAQAGSSIR